MKDEIKELLSNSPEIVQWFAREIYSNISYGLSIFKSYSQPGDRLYWLYLLSFVLMAMFSYVYYYKKSDEGYSLKKFLSFCFPKGIYLHPSAIVDYKIYMVKRFFRLSNILLSLYSTATVIYVVSRVLNYWLGPIESEPDVNWWTMIALTVAVIIVSDFGFYIDHYMEHFIPVLWPIHRVHHSAEILTPFTRYRTHFLSGIASWPIRVTIDGLLQGVIFYFFLGKPEIVTILGVNAVQYVFNLFGSNLRHSHIWFSFGPVLSHIFISPAQHQIHHSVEPKHWNKNFGGIFAIWDWMFGTLYVPQEKEELVFGLGVDEPQLHPSLMTAYTEPFVELTRIIRSSDQLAWLGRRVASNVGNSASRVKKA